MVDRLVRGGMDVARLNFSHGDHAWHARTLGLVTAAATRHRRWVGVLADLQGPKIRTGPTRDGRPVTLRAGDTLVLTTRAVRGERGLMGVDDPGLPGRVSRGDRLLLDDGLIALRVARVSGREIRCDVVNGGALGPHKGINLPGVRWRRPALTAKDAADLEFALRHKVSYVALSFVQSAANVKAVKARITRAGTHMPVIVKLEKPEAIDDLENILDVADGVMIARGDLGVELGPEKVPVLQKRIIARAHAHNLPVITATQMLESMKENPRPTRAEVSDVANAVFDDTDAVMLSAETASGAWPLQALAMMDTVVREAEAHRTDGVKVAGRRRATIPETIADALHTACGELDVKVIAAFTEYGRSAQLISLYRPRAPIVAFSRNPVTLHRLAICWGIIPRLIGAGRNVEDLTRRAERLLLRGRLVRAGDLIAAAAGTPVGRPGHTNLLKLFHAGGRH
jgi:pyruvate kinase